MYTLKGRTAALTAAPYDVVEAFLAGGMNVAIITHGIDRVKAYIETLPEEWQERCIAMKNDGGDAAALVRVAEHFGSLDVVIPNQGGGLRYETLDEVTDEEFERKLKNIILGDWRMIKAALPYLEKSSAGRIILMTSAGCRNAGDNESICDCAARGGVISMAYRLARDLAEKGITVNCIAKGAIDEKGVGEAYAESVMPYVPMKRTGTQADVASAAAWLASEEAGFVTGQVINVCGGMYMG